MKCALIFAFCILLSEVAQSASDYQLSVTNDGLSGWLLTDASSSQIYSGTIPSSDNPTLNLIVGKRYAIRNFPGAEHPFQVLAKGSSDAGDVVLLSYGAEAGSLEADAGINWVDDGSTITFTVTTALVNAMNSAGHTPGYRCSIHTSSMRGDFAIFGNGAAIADPIAARIPKGTITLQTQTIAQGLAAPLGAEFPNDGTGRLFVYDQTGVVRVVTAAGDMLTTAMLDVSSRMVALTPSYDERGLTGLALHPQFATNRKLYTHTSEPVGPPADFTIPGASGFDHQEVIAEWKVLANNPNRVDPASRRELLRMDHPQFNHNGGAIHFGKDGYLYIGTGDGGNANDVGAGHGANGNAQDTNVALGKILRIDVNTTNSANHQYGIPAGNPFIGGGGLREIWAYGVRNPYSFSFDSQGGAFYLGEVGQNHIEEIDRVTSITAGANFGWRYKEGTFNFDPATGDVVTVPVVPLPAGLTDPIAQYDHDDGIAVVGGFVYRGTTIPELAGLYVFGDLAKSFTEPGRLFYLDSGSQIKEMSLAAPLGNVFVKGFAQDLAGEIYVCVSGNIGPSGTAGKLLKLKIFRNAAQNWRGYKD